MKNKQVIVNRVFNHPIENVFNAFINPELMMQWFSPEGMTTPLVEVDLRVGGRYAITMRFTDEIPFKGMEREVTVRGVYKVIDKPNKLVFTWKWDGQEDETEVSLELDAISENQTALTLVHAGFDKEVEDYAEGVSPKDHKSGWTTGFNKLDLLLSSHY